MKKIDRIIKYIENQGIASSDFERKAGVSNAYFLNTRKRGSEVTYKALTKIKENVPEHYYKIFPEEQPERFETTETDPGYVLGGGKQPCGEFVKEIEYLKKRVTDLERTIEDKIYIIDLQKGLIHYEDKSKASG